MAEATLNWLKTAKQKHSSKFIFGLIFFNIWVITNIIHGFVSYCIIKVHLLSKYKWSPYLRIGQTEKTDLDLVPIPVKWWRNFCNLVQLDFVVFAMFEQSHYVIDVI